MLSIFYFVTTDGFYIMIYYARIGGQGTTINCSYSEMSGNVSEYLGMSWSTNPNPVPIPYFGLHACPSSGATPIYSHHFDILLHFFSYNDCSQISAYCVVHQAISYPQKHSLFSRNASHLVCACTFFCTQTFPTRFHF